MGGRPRRKKASLTRDLCDHGSRNTPSLWGISGFDPMVPSDFCQVDLSGLVGGAEKFHWILPQNKSVNKKPAKSEVDRAKGPKSTHYSLPFSCFPVVTSEATKAKGQQVCPVCGLRPGPEAMALGNMSGVMTPHDGWVPGGRWTTTRSPS